jgi:hypothetical protein
MWAVDAALQTGCMANIVSTNNSLTQGDDFWYEDSPMIVMLKLGNVNRSSPPPSFFFACAALPAL